MAERRTNPQKLRNGSLLVKHHMIVANVSAHDTWQIHTTQTQLFRAVRFTVSLIFIFFSIPSSVVVKLSHIIKWEFFVTVYSLIAVSVHRSIAQTTSYSLPIFKKFCIYLFTLCVLMCIVNKIQIMNAKRERLTVTGRWILWKER